MVRKMTGLEPFFAEEVQDLQGLDTNILNKLRDCVAFITVLHPRGEIERPDGSVITRASVWIEQEIAIATYIRQIERRDLPVIVFKHISVGREGIRELLQLNPIPFEDESEVLAALPERLAPWKSLRTSRIRLELLGVGGSYRDGHSITDLQVHLINGTNRPIGEFHGELHIPSALLKHESPVYPTEFACTTSGERCFRLMSQGKSIAPHDNTMIFTISYCTACAVDVKGDFVSAAVVADAKIRAIAWIDGEEYSVDKTVKQLAISQ